MNQSMNLAAFLDAAVARDLLSESDRVLGELLLRRANVAGDAAVPMAVAVALLSRARADGHSALSLGNLAAEATELLRELSAAIATSGDDNQLHALADIGALLRGGDAEWWRAALNALPWVVQVVNGDAVNGHAENGHGALPLVLHGSLLQFRRYFDAEQRIAARIGGALTHRSPTFRVITGGPGTGKTTRIAELLVETLERTPELRVALAAPTG